jgi:tRNA(His) 5'-end guanylyltransferase
MRVYETAHDHRVLPQIFMVARIDGRNFTRLTREVHKFEAPFDERFRDMMVATTEHLMQCGFRILYGYTQSDEISLLFHRDENLFERKLRKYNSILAGEASAAFALALGAHAAFDCRISQFPNAGLICDYFRWRQEDAHRNALNGWCYWTLRKDGLDAATASRRLTGLSVADRNELLFRHGINFNDLPLWQKRGVGLHWEACEKSGVNPADGRPVAVERRRVGIDHNLPMRDAYSAFVLSLLGGE